MNLSSLLYGGPGSGKTTFAVSSFWDWKNQRPVVRDGKELKGKLVLFGRENNPALGVPEDSIIRFSSPSLDNDKWLRDFEGFMASLIKAARQGNKLDALVIDGMSEWDLLYEEVFERMNAGTRDKFAKWEALLRDGFSTMQRADTIELGCQILVTARVMEKKKAIQSTTGKVIASGDPEYMDFDYYPSLRGSFRLHFPHYFNLVLYADTNVKLVNGKKRPVHSLSMVRHGDFYVKNVFEYQWLEEEKPIELYNPSYWEVYDMLTQRKEAAGA